MRALRSWHLRSQLAVGVIGGALVAFVVTAWLLIPVTKGLVRDRIDDRLILDAPAVSADAIGDGDVTRWEAEYEVLIVTSDGGGAAASVATPPVPDLDTWADLPITGPRDVAAAEVGGVSYRYVATEVGAWVGGGDAGRVVIVAVPVSDLDALVDTLVGTFLMVGGPATVALGALTWWWLDRRLRPLEDLAVQAEAIAAGDARSDLAIATNSRELTAVVAALNSMLASLQAALTSRQLSEDRMRKLVADAGHELRTPLTTISGYLDLDRHGGLPDRTEHDRAIGRALSEARRLGRIVADLQLLADVDGEVPVLTEPVDVAAVAASAVADFAVTDHDRVYRFGSPPAGDRSPVTALVDSDSVRQVVVNLLDNVRLHTPAGATAEVHVDGEGSQVALVVSDDGPGVPREHIGRMTDRFWRLDTSRSRATGGSGLGLSIVQGILARHGGSLQIKPNRPRGLQVTASFPSARGVHVAAEQVARQGAPDLAPAPRS